MLSSTWLLGLTLLAPLSWGGAVEDAEALLRAERPGAALTQLQDHLDQTPNDVAAHELLIDIMLNAGLAEQVRQEYADRAKANPKDADGWYLFGRASMDLGEADRAYQEAIALQPGHARALTGRAAMMRATGRIGDAVPLYVEALQSDDDVLEAWSGLWSCQLMQEDTQSAALTAERASQAVPGAPEPWLALALLRPDRAREYLAAGLKNNPGEYRLTVDYARRVFQEQDLAEAQKAYAAALRIAADDPTVRIEAALLSEIAAGRLSWDGAQVLIDTRTQANTPETFRRVDGVANQHPRSALARVVRGNIRQIQKDPAAAEADYRAALSLSPDSAEASAALGLLLLAQRRPSEAITLLQEASQQRPDDVALGIATAVALSEGDDPGAGGMKLLELEEQFPYEAGPPLALARLLMQLGEAGRAYSVLLEAVQRMPEPQLMLALAGIAHAAGRTTEAAAALQRLGEQTGDPRFEASARQLLSGQQE